MLGSHLYHKLINVSKQNRTQLRTVYLAHYCILYSLLYPRHSIVSKCPRLSTPVNKQIQHEHSISHKRQLFFSPINRTKTEGPKIKFLTLDKIDDINIQVFSKAQVIRCGCISLLHPCQLVGQGTHNQSKEVHLHLLNLRLACFIAL